VIADSVVPAGPAPQAATLGELPGFNATGPTGNGDTPVVAGALLAGVLPAGVLVVAVLLAGAAEELVPAVAV
jgi:hypothetical protein